jgi:ribonucleoside-diphosphate reductase alpha chain
MTDNQDKILVKGAIRRELPRMRTAKTFSFRVSDSHGYITVGEFDDGVPGELFINVAKQGSTLRGIMDAFAISVSHGLQFGVPLKDYVKSFTSMSFAPAGITDDPDIRTASSLMDYIFRKLAQTYLSFDDRLELGLASIDDMPSEQISLLDVHQSVESESPQPQTTVVENSKSLQQTPVTNQIKPKKNDDTAPLCFNCGNQTQKAGSCYVCTSCGSTTGCS